MLRNLLVGVCLVSLAAVAPAQNCSTLGIVADAETVTVSLDGPAPAGALPNFAFLAVGDTLGTLPIDLGSLGSFTLGVLPDSILPLGATDTNGDILLVVDNLPLPAETLQAQGVVLSFNLPTPPFNGVPSFALSFCVSNIVAFLFGTGV